MDSLVTGFFGPTFHQSLQYNAGHHCGDEDQRAGKPDDDIQ
jgi:hypothetical protein